MSKPTPKFALDIGNLDEELDRILATDESNNNASPEPEQPTEEIHAHVKMANLFVNHSVDENPQATARRLQKIATISEREAQNRKSEEEQGEKKALVEQIFEVYGGTIPKQQIKKLLIENNFNGDAVLDKIAESVAEICDDYLNPQDHKVRTVYSPKVPIVFNKEENKSSIPVQKMPVQSVDEAIDLAIKLAKEFRQRSEHRTQAAFNHGAKDPRFGALTAIAREEKKKAEQLNEQADAFEASKVQDAIDLHLMTAERAIRFVNMSIESVRKRRHWQRKLEVITGRGKNNSTGKPVLKMAVMKFLDEMGIKYELLSENPGVVIVKL